MARTYRSQGSLGLAALNQNQHLLSYAKAHITDQIHRLQAELEALDGVDLPATFFPTAMPSQPMGRRQEAGRRVSKMSEEARKRISEAQKARWAKRNAASASAPEPQVQEEATAAVAAAPRARKGVARKGAARGASRSRRAKSNDSGRATSNETSNDSNTDNE